MAKRRKNWVLSFKWNTAGPEALDPTETNRRYENNQSTYTANIVDGFFLASEIDLCFGSYIAELRQRRNLTRPELAKAANIHPMAIPDIEAGVLHDQFLTAAVVRRLLQAFQMERFDRLPVGIRPGDIRRR